MAKTSSVEREKKRSKLAERHRAKILDIKEKLRKLYIEAADPVPILIRFMNKLSNCKKNCSAYRAMLT
jgi:hypothetical protein